MSRILRWSGYVATGIAAILIIISVIGGFCHNRCHHAPAPNATCCAHHPSCDKDAVKSDSTSCKHHETDEVMTDSTKQKPCCAAHHESMRPEGCSMERQHGNLLELAISLLLLAMALFMISKHCCCKKNCDCKEEKKEA